MAQPKLRFQRKDGTEFPEWKEKSIGSLCEAIGDGLHKAPTYDINGDYYFINGNNLKNGKIFIEKETPKVSADTIQQSDKRLNSSTILMSINGTIGNLAYYYNENVMLGKSVAYLQVKSNVCKNYIYFSLQTKSIINKFKLSLTGTTIKNLGLNAIRETSIFIPCLEEQQKVADFLSTVDEVIAQSEAEVQNLEQQKKAAMQKIFSQEVRFRREDGTEFPKWEEIKLENAVDFLDEKRKPITSKYRNKGQYPYYGASGIIDYIDDYIFDEELVLLSEDGANIVDRNYRVSFIATGKYWVNNHAHCLRTKNGFSSYFISEALENIDYTVYNTGSAQPKLNQEVCRNLPLVCPCLEEQQKIADILSAYDEAISYAKQELDKWKELKKGLLQQMFL